MGRLAMSQIDYADVQGLVRFGYGHMTSASYALVRIRNADAAKAWLRSAPITTAVAQKPPPKTAMNIAFTASGLRALGVPESIIACFSHEFRGGMGQESRARQLGDVGKNAPSNWSWGGYGREPHALVMFFAEPDQLDSFIQRSAAIRTGVKHSRRSFHLARAISTAVEPFGFADGISQPQIDWEQQLERPCTQLGLYQRCRVGRVPTRLSQRVRKDNRSAFARVRCCHHRFAQRGGGAQRKKIWRETEPIWSSGNWNRTSEASGSFFMSKLAEILRTPSNWARKWSAVREQAILWCRSSQSRFPARIQRTVTQNQFTYESDPVGALCPFGAHVRRTNPRNNDFPEQRLSALRKLMIMLGFGPKGFYDDLTSSVRFHRILRRGREFGSELLPEEALQAAPPNESPRGLHFVCLNANISRQFEFLQNAWITNTKFSGITGESDPLLGNRESIPGCPITGNFTIPGDGTLRRRVSGLPQFVTVRGGAYFFLPSLRALRYFAGA